MFMCGIACLCVVMYVCVVLYVCVWYCMFVCGNVCLSGNLSLIYYSGLRFNWFNLPCYIFYLLFNEMLKDQFNDVGQRIFVFMNNISNKIKLILCYENNSNESSHLREIKFIKG